MDLDEARQWIDELNLDASEKLLIFGNLVTIAMALIFNYPLATIIWLYWLESVIIGFFAFLKILFVTGKNAPPFLKRLPLALFFSVHYGGFHLGYLAFLAVMPWFAVGLDRPDYLIMSGAVLFLVHAVSFFMHVIKQHEGGGENNMQMQFLEPYGRIIPMHLTIIASGFVIGIFAVFRSVVLLFAFMAIKTVADIMFHRWKHQLAKTKPKRR